MTGHLVEDSMLTLAWCGHHYAKNEAQLVVEAVVLADERPSSHKAATV
ncbi:hypothetical protein V5R04_07350 [Jonesiaceae bacterium BS-20]|uniref:DUF7455 domain-containing protein n=1 Tax=Jonesiaceae bacterium BS-20 TaxID=3120821 RepID=A0AAU7E040_9MICO